MPDARPLSGPPQRHIQEARVQFDALGRAVEGWRVASSTISSLQHPFSAHQQLVQPRPNGCVPRHGHQGDRVDTTPAHKRFNEHIPRCQYARQRLARRRPQGGNNATPVEEQSVAGQVGGQRGVVGAGGENPLTT